MSLPTGIYTIRSALESNPYVSRNGIEDKSFHPKMIACQPQDLQPNPGRINWIVEKASDDRYFLRAGGSPTAVIDGKVFAILMSEPPPEEWKLQRIPQHGENQFLIIAKDGLGWILTDYEQPVGTQVEVAVITSTRSDPPQYRPQQRWIIERVVE